MYTIIDVKITIVQVSYPNRRIIEEGYENHMIPPPRGDEETPALSVYPPKRFNIVFAPFRECFYRYVFVWLLSPRVYVPEV